MRTSGRLRVGWCRIEGNRTRIKAILVAIPKEDKETLSKFRWRYLAQDGCCIIIAVVTMVHSICVENIPYTLRINPFRLLRACISNVVRCSSPLGGKGGTFDRRGECCIPLTQWMRMTNEIRAHAPKEMPLIMGCGGTPREILDWLQYLWFTWH